MNAASPPFRDCRFVASSRKDLKTFPEDVRCAVGHALYEVQIGLEPLSAKALRGFSGRGVLEIIEDHDGSTYRAVYTVRFAEAVYVLHCFQKKSKKGAATPKPDIDVIRARLKVAEAHYQAKSRTQHEH